MKSYDLPQSEKREKRFLQRIEDRPVAVQLCGISKRFDKRMVIHPLDFKIYEGDFLALLGPSGCGKTTLLRLIGGFLEPTTGTMEIAGENVTELGSERRRTNMVFQSYGLFPHMTVRQNIAYGLRIAKKSKAEIKRRVSKIINLVHLTGFEERLPIVLSGGQQQRVALARALVMEPAVLLLDEPLAALDLKLRKVMQEELRQLHRAIGGTFLFVTHDQGEAMGLANSIAVIQDGRIVQQGTPEEIYTYPATEFVAGFIGDANMFRGQRKAGVIELQAGPTFNASGHDGKVVVVVRPHSMQLVDDKAMVEVKLRGRLEDRVYMGEYLSLKIELKIGQVIFVNKLAKEITDQFAVGADIVVGWSSADQCIVEVDR